LAHLGTDDGLAFGGFVDLFDHILGFDLRSTAIVPERMALLPDIDFLEPIRPVAVLDVFEHLRQHVLAIPHNGDMDRDVLADGRRINVNVQNRRAGGKLVQPTCDAIVEPRPHGNDEIGVGGAWKWFLRIHLPKKGNPIKATVDFSLEAIKDVDAAPLAIIKGLCVGKVNKEIVSLILQHGGRAVGLSGKDGGLIQAKKLHLYGEPSEGRPPELIDLGMVGEVVRVNPEVIKALEVSDFIPVIAPVGVDEKGTTYNINADWVAGNIAASLRCERLIFMTDVDGILDEEGGLISTLPRAEVEPMIEDGRIRGGMIPKARAAMFALEHGVKKAHIIKGTVPHATILELFTDSGIGTEIV